MHHQHPPFWKLHFFDRDPLPKSIVQPCFRATRLREGRRSTNVPWTAIRHAQDDLSPTGATLLALSRLFHLSVPAMESGKGFKIPDPPSASEGSPMSRRNIQDLKGLLPKLQEGEILQVDTLAEDASLVPLNQALKSLREAGKQGRMVWLVVGGKAPRKPED